ncbi:unnamed protein product [Spirodela intermedia]|uniref:CCHC-type domain-containing protein n=1 Tax=Spirodela intermedia TaxID=51605 RepID=A0A7I8JA32_SPIIN|nr:unnamed protein product [Spirodela intermedia]CAA6666635.1 unnamed protein product [Spirodela intermedia]
MQRGGDGGGGAAAPTGCFKCGRPGHWSRDCPSGNTANPIPGLSSSSKLPQGSKRLFPGKDKNKKTPRTRPKLTPELLLSDDGIGYVLRHFPEHSSAVDDLGRLIDLYADWHSRLIPYYSFSQFVQKVEQVGASKRVRRCIDELRQRIADGGDPTKLHEPPTAQAVPDQEPDGGVRKVDPAFDDSDPPLESGDIDDNQEEMINEVYHTATYEPSHPLHRGSQGSAASEGNPEISATLALSTDQGTSEKSEAEITEEQRTRMEANRVKALERAAERSRSLPVL